MQVVLDTSAYSQMRRGHADALERLADAEVVHVPSIVVGELRAGFELGTRARDNLAVLHEFLDEPFVSTLNVSPAVASHYGRLFAALRRAGTPIPINDVWIAACAIHLAAPVLTFDTDFSVIPGLDTVLLYTADQ